MLPVQDFSFVFTVLFDFLLEVSEMFVLVPNILMFPSNWTVFPSSSPVNKFMLQVMGGGVFC